MGPTMMVVAAYMFGGQTRTAGGTRARARALARRGDRGDSGGGGGSDGGDGEGDSSGGGSGYVYGGGKLAGNIYHIYQRKGLKQSRMPFTK
jgi:hypothetical protein